MKSNIPTLDFSEVLGENQLNFNIFYYTDHHWTTRAAFAANNALLEELSIRFGFEYDKKITDISNYNIEIINFSLDGRYFNFDIDFSKLSFL